MGSCVEWFTTWKDIPFLLVATERYSHSRFANLLKLIRNRQVCDYLPRVLSRTRITHVGYHRWRGFQASLSKAGLLFDRQCLKPTTRNRKIQSQGKSVRYAAYLPLLMLAYMGQRSDVMISRISRALFANFARQHDLPDARLSCYCLNRITLSLSSTGPPPPGDVARQLGTGASLALADSLRGFEGVSGFSCDLP